MQDHLGERGLLEGRLEGLDELVGQLLDEADGVGHQVVAAGELEAPGGGSRVAKSRSATRPRPRSARSAGSTCRRWCSRRARPGQRGSRAGPGHAAVGLQPLDPAAQRRDPVAGEPAVGLDLRLARAPGADAAGHAAGAAAGWVQSRRRRGRRYSSWASSTCSLPSAEWAWSAKMSRITAVRSITVTPSALSRLRCCRGASSSSQATRLVPLAAISAFSSSSLLRPK